MMIQRNSRGLKRMEVLMASHVKVFLDNKYNSHIHTARKAKIASTRNVYGKTNKTKEKLSEAYLEPTRTSMMKRGNIDT